MTHYFARRALLPTGPADDVLIEVVDGRFSRIEAGVVAAADTTRLDGLVIPGLANCHSHAFHRALRGHTQRQRGSFWTWRDQMYAVAATLSPDSYYSLARATYAEMVSTGITAVGEFHYLHHDPTGKSYADPNAMGHALISAARDVGMRITLLDTCYLASGFGQPPEGVQQRYSDADADAWASRVSRIHEREGVKVGAAVHSVRAVPAEQLHTVVAASVGRPLHVHLSEQVAENQACLAAHQCTPTQLLADHGVLHSLATAVHATHLTDQDIDLLGATGTTSCFCPTTERDLADGIGPASRLRDAGSSLSLGSDSHAVIDLFEEMRAVEMHERLATQQRGHWTAAELVSAATRHDSLGWVDAGRIEVGARADLVVLDDAAPTTAGTGGTAETVVFAATSTTPTQVMVDGVWVFQSTDRSRIGADLARSVTDVLG